MRMALIASGSATLAPMLIGCMETTSSPDVTGSSSACPSDLGGNECEYYQDGYRLGANDASMNMSMAYERHEGYDSTFEPYFARGYNAGWSATQ